jgi:hypothetical protein
MQRDCFSPKFIAVSLIANIVVAGSAVLFLPSQTTAPLATMNSGQTPDVVRTISNSALKADRLGRYTSRRTSIEVKGVATMPDGCNAAFGEITKSRDFVARCATNIRPAARPA